MKGLGTGALALGLLAGDAAGQATTGLDVSVEAGKGDEDEWLSRERFADNPVKARIDVSGVEPGARTPLAYMVAPAGSDGGFVSDAEVHGRIVDDTFPGGRLSIFHGEWNPTRSSAGGRRATTGSSPRSRTGTSARSASRSPISSS
ncbi:MAG: hypothetical protein ABEJ23_03970 [Haloarculaceae archaeon]